MKKGHYTDYKEIRGYVLARKPDALHMVGLMPIVRTTAFDMVSDGQEFKLWIPPKNRFVVGKNDVADAERRPADGEYPSAEYLRGAVDPPHRSGDRDCGAGEWL